nr:uncharacterized protein LOC114827733 isoform X2 [Malus domestica]
MSLGMSSFTSRKTAWLKGFLRDEFFSVFLFGHQRTFFSQAHFKSNRWKLPTPSLGKTRKSRFQRKSKGFYTHCCEVAVGNENCLVNLLHSKILAYA